MTTYYVRPTNGNDTTGDGLSFATAWKTTQKALDAAIAGDEIRCCAEATETIATKIDVDFTTGTTIAPVKIVGADSVDGTPLTTGFYTIQASAAITAIIELVATVDFTQWQRIKFDGNSQATYCVLNSAADGSEGHRFLFCDVTGATSHGIHFRGADWLCFGTNVYNNGGSGISHSAANRGNLIFMGGSLHDNTSHGWDNNGGKQELRNTLVYDNGGCGMNNQANSSRTQISNCVFYGNSSHGVLWNASSARNTLYAYNNVFSTNTGYGMFFGQSDVNVMAVQGYNLFYNNSTDHYDYTPSGFGNILASDPMFTSVTDGSENFTPLTGSPLIGAGLGGENIGVLSQGTVAPIIISRRDNSLTLR